MWYLSHASIRLQPVFLGNFQLSRLYYCFAARPEGAGPNGYPQWVFFVMYAIGGLCVLFTCIPYGFQIPQSCFIDEDYTFHAHYFPFSVSKSWTLTIRTYFEMSLYMSWDIAILLLFCFSVRSIARTQMLLHQPSHSEDAPNGSGSENVPNGHSSSHSEDEPHGLRSENVPNSDPSTVKSVNNGNRVSNEMVSEHKVSTNAVDPTLSPVFRTLYRVLTVTLFYEIVCIIIFTVNNVVLAQLPVAHAYEAWSIIGELFLISTWTLSAYLMLDHNRWGYWRFIRGLHVLKLHYCCCCYRHMVPWQLNDLQKQQNHNLVYTVDLKAEAPGIPENDSYQTCTDTAEVERNRMKNREEINHMKEQRARQRVESTQKEGQ